MRGFNIDDAWRLAMQPGGARSVVNFQGGGYAVPVAPRKILPPDPKVPIAALVPGRRVWIIPGVTFGVWRMFRPGRPVCPKCYGTTTHRCRTGDCRHCDDCDHAWIPKED